MAVSNKEPAKYDIIIRNANIISMSDKRPQIEELIDLAIRDGKIIAIERNIIGHAEKIIDATDKFVIPGFINCHSHVAMGLFRETDRGVHLREWLEDFIWPIEHKLTKADIYNLAEFGAGEMIDNGITTFNDMYFFSNEIYHATKFLGLEALHCKGVMDIAGEKSGIANMKESDELRASIPQYNYVYGIHGLYTSSPAYVEKAAAIIKKNNFRLHMHFCEDDTEVKIIKEKHNVRHASDALTKYFKDLKNKIILAHGVVLDEYDINLISKMKNVSIVHCPISNGRLACGVAPVKKLIDHGVNVCLGTDGQGTGSSFSMLTLMRFALLCQRNETKDPKCLSPYDVLKMATINGAKALGIDNNTGSIDAGKDADLQIYSFKSFELFPINDSISDIVFNASSHDIYGVISKGKILVENYELVHVDQDMLSNKIKTVRKQFFGRKQ